MKKRFAGILLLVLLLPFVCSLAHTDAFYVNDYAEVLSEEQEASILSTARALADQTKAQVVVLTVQSLEGKSISEYALEVARDWGIGDKNENNGVLILLATEDREIRVEVGLGLEGCLPDGKTGRLIDTYAIPYYEDDDFGKGTEQLFYAVVNEVCAEYGVESLAVLEEPPEEGIGLYNAIAMLLLAAAMIAATILTRGRIFFVFFGGFGPRGGPRGGGGGGRSFGGGGGFGGGGAGRRF